MCMLIEKLKTNFNKIYSLPPSLCRCTVAAACTRFWYVKKSSSEHTEDWDLARNVVVCCLDFKRYYIFFALTYCNCWLLPIYTLSFRLLLPISILNFCTTWFSSLVLLPNAKNTILRLSQSFILRSTSSSVVACIFDLVSIRLVSTSFYIQPRRINEKNICKLHASTDYCHKQKITSAPIRCCFVGVFA